MGWGWGWGGGSAANGAKVDAGSSKPHIVFGACPCLTKSRGQSRAFWTLQHGRPLSIREMARLQGLDLAGMTVPVTDPQMGALLGNGFTATVIMRVMSAAITLSEAALPATAPGSSSQDSPNGNGVGEAGRASQNSNESATGDDGPATGGKPGTTTTPPAAAVQPATGGGDTTIPPAVAAPVFAWEWNPDADTPEKLL